MNPKIIFTFIAGLALGVLIGFMYSDFQNRRQELGSTHTPHGQPVSAENPHQMDNIMTTIQNLENILKDEPNNYEALLSLGNLYYDANMFEKAAVFYQRAFDVKGDDPNLITDLGTCYRQLGQPAEAVKYYDIAFTKDPLHWRSVYNSCVVSLHDLKDSEKAVFYFSKLEAVAPPDLDLTDLKKELGI